MNDKEEKMVEKMKLGFIGVGLMGHGLAKNLMKQGHEMTLLQHRGNQPIDDLVRMGARLADTPKEVAAGADVVFLCVTGSPQVEACVYGPNGLLESLRSGAIVVDATTGDPVTTVKVAAAVQSRGGRFVDAPMTRTSQHAEDGCVNTMLGGDAATIAEIRPLVQAYSENIFIGGEVGSGLRMKLLHNYISLGTLALLAEAYTCAGKAGVDRKVLTEVLATGGGDSVVLKRLLTFLDNGQPGSMLFSLANASKDLRCFTHMAEDLQVGTFVGEAVHQTFVTAANVGGGDKMIPELVNILCGMHGAPLCGQ
jgi:3-hydroxyisobutyrate dehydrogenase-like beta-hydroxyacid dehydrogenase